MLRRGSKCVARALNGSATWQGLTYVRSYWRFGLYHVFDFADGQVILPANRVGVMCFGRKK